jgi:hypothetical protein
MGLRDPVEMEHALRIYADPSNWGRDEASHSSVFRHGDGWVVARRALGFGLDKLSVAIECVLSRLSRGEITQEASVQEIRKIFDEHAPF